MKIFIIGISGSGKSYLANRLSEKLKIKHFDLDDLYWETKYSKKRDKQERAKILNSILENENDWVFEGIYNIWTENIRDKADLIIWLDLPKNLMTWRILKRWLKRRKESREKLKEVLSLIKFQRSYRKYKEKFDGSFYESHKDFLKDFKNLIIVKNKKDLEEVYKKFGL